jgi:methyl-accepting chemotaxis protein
MDTNRRRPIRNFLFHRELQLPLIKSILALVASSTFIACAAILAVYFYYSQFGYLYFMSNDFEKPLVRQSLLGIALPGLLFAEGVTLVLGFLIALIVSRKIAVPLYKLERWAKAIAEGQLNGNIHFRERGEYKSLMEQCNLAEIRIRKLLKDLDRELAHSSLCAKELPSEVRDSLDRTRALVQEWKVNEEGNPPSS